MTKEEAKEILSGYVKACIDYHIFYIKEDDFPTLDMFGYEEFIEAMTMGIKALSKPSLPVNIDEAAQKVEDYYDVGEEHGFLYCHRGDIKGAFKAGAEWMARQGEIHKDKVEN